MVHEGKVEIESSMTALRFVKPNGQSFDSVAPEHVHPFDWAQLPAQREERGIHTYQVATAETR